MGKDEKYNKLAFLISLFKDKPHFLAKYLIDNSAINENFTDRLIKNEKLNKIYNGEIEINSTFNTITKMEEYYNSLIEEDKDKQELTIELNNKLSKYIKSEKFEAAAKLRDYMNRNNIKKI